MTPATKNGKQSKLTKKTGSLSSVAKHLILPKNIVATGWPAVRETCKRFGTVFDEWQDGLGRAVLAKRENGLYAAGIDGVVLSLPRQVGKTFTIGNIILALCVNQPKLKILWTAHRTRTSGETFKFMQGLVNRQKILPYVKEVRRANGQEEISFRNGSRVLFGARESGFGRGFDSVDMIVFDEAQILSHKALDDMVPATNTAPNALVVYVGTPPKPSDVSEVFTDKREQALTGKTKDLLYVEFGADRGANPDSRAAWRRANPSFPARTNESAILRMRRQLSEASFRREALGIWDEVVKTELAIDRKAWKKTLGEGEVVRSRCFAVKFSVDGQLVGLAAAGKLSDGTVLVDGLRVEMASQGIGWLVDYLTDPQRLGGTAQIVVDGKSGTGYLVDRLHDEGVKKRVVLLPSTGDVVSAHAMFAAAITEGTMTHRAGKELDREAGHAVRRRIGTQGGFGWDAPDGDSVVLLDAVTLAFWAAKTTRRRPKGQQKDKKKRQVRVS